VLEWFRSPPVNSSVERQVAGGEKKDLLAG